jgi:predicted XRE-type DNA-binding protein
MSVYTATATREGRWWVIDATGLGVTQSRTLAEARTWAQGLIEAATGEAGADVTITPSLPDGTIERVRHAQTVTARADAELRVAANEIREATRHLLQTGMTQQDVATIPGVSRVAQLREVSQRVLVEDSEVFQPLENM